MIDFLLSPLGIYGLGGTSLAALIAAAWFFPMFRRELITIAIFVGLVMFIYRKGQTHGESKIRALWDEASRRAAEFGRSARARAERDVAADPDGVRPDPHDRDR